MKIRMEVLAALVVMGSMAHATANPMFLRFPVSGYGPFTSKLISTVLDHEVDYDLTQPSLPFNTYSTHGPYGYSGGILSYTGELFVSTSSYPPGEDACYPKPGNAHQSSVWSTRLQSLYKGTSGSGAANCTATRALNYDNHPGYDYLVLEGKSVNPAAAGDIIFEKCIFTFTNSESCDAYGAVAVDHGNGFVTQYLHMANLNYGNANNGMNQPVTRTWVLGTVSDTHVTGHPHLHFEVLRRKSVTVDKNNYYARANYMIVDPYGYKTGSYYADRLQSRPGCLWVKVCLY